LNRDFSRSSTGFEFYQTGKTITINDAWHLCSASNELDFKTPLHQGRAGLLNIYLCDVYEGNNNSGVAGYAYFAQQVQRQSLVYDGVVSIGFNLVNTFNTFGYPTHDNAVRATISHEVGHWVSHLHVLQSSMSFFTHLVLYISPHFSL
jgi:hypothetical protein